MSLVWADGCESDIGWINRKYNVVTSNLPSTVTSRAGSGNCYSLAGTTGGGRDLMRPLSATEEHATLIVGTAWRATEAQNNTYPEYGLINLSSDSGVTHHISLGHNGSNRWQVYRFDQILATGPADKLFVADQWYYVELKATLHDSTGSVELRINGETIISATGIDTKNGGTKSVFDSVYFNGPAGTGQTARVDDIYILNGAGSAPYNDFLGDIKVETLRPNGNGNANQFTGSDGNSTDNYLLVDESTYSNGDYVQDSTSGDRDLYTFSNLAITSGTVYGAVVAAAMSKSDSGSKTAELTVRTGATNYDGSAQTLSTSDFGYKEVWEQNPNTAAAWSISEINGAEFGVQVT